MNGGQKFAPLDIIAAMQIQKILEDKSSLFWTLQFLGWTGWGVSFYLGVMVWEDAPSTYNWYVPIITVIGLVITLALRWFYRFTWNSSGVKRVAGVLIGSYLAGLAWRLCRITLYDMLFEELSKADKMMAEFYGLEIVFHYMVDALQGFWPMFVWSVLYFGIKYYLLLEEERSRHLNSLAMAHEAQLKMLRYQLNPHFLFNTLNAISTLILDKDTVLANTMVTRLSRFLRYSLDNDPMQKVTLAEEITALKLYLDIETVRFDERLQIHLDIEPDAEQALVPSLLLQPLVENAIKYAIANAINGGSIGISARVFGVDLLLSVADDGPGLDLRNGRLPKGSGVGLANCRERLKELYGDNQSFRLGRTEPHGLTINIRIPLERAAPPTEPEKRSK